MSSSIKCHIKVSWLRILRAKGNLHHVLVSLLNEMLQRHDHMYTHALPLRSNNSGKDLCKQLSSMLWPFSHCSKRSIGDAQDKWSKKDNTGEKSNSSGGKESRTEHRRKVHWQQTRRNLPQSHTQIVETYSVRDVPTTHSQC